MTGSNTSKTKTLTARIVSFLTEVGIENQKISIDHDTFLPGIHIENGVILIDEAKLAFPGDLLHEAGHLAVMSPEMRKEATGDLEPGPEMAQTSLELAAIAWSYAAATHIGIDPAIVFHQEGYRNSSDAYLENFDARRYVGVPVLVWKGLTTEASFPAMESWLATF